MKQTIFGLAVCSAVFAASAALVVPSENTLGVLATDVHADVAEVLPVPFVAADGSALTLGQLVDAQTLQDDDRVRVWTGSQYDILVWSASDSAWRRANNDNAEATEGTTTADVQVPVGHALRFVLDAAEGETAQTRTVRFFGEVPATPVTQLTGKTTALLANPTTEGFALTSLTGKAGDAVLLLAKDATSGASTPIYTYQWDDATNEDGTKKGWYRQVMGTVERYGMKVHTYSAEYDAATRTIPAGGAFWYVAADGAQIPWTAGTTGSTGTK